MPRLRPKKPRFEPDEIVVSWTTFATNESVVKRGTRLRGDNPVVLSHPHYFARDGASDAELRALEANARPDPPRHVPEFTRPQQTIAPERQAIAICSFHVGFGVGPTVTKGQVLDINHPLVRAHPEYFRTAGIPLEQVQR